jgi:hypothetical protein
MLITFAASSKSHWFLNDVRSLPHLENTFGIWIAMPFSLKKRHHKTRNEGKMTMRNASRYDSYEARKLTVSGYELLVQEIMENEDAELYYVNFLFNQLAGGRSAQLEQMGREVTRFHGILRQHVVRKWTSRRWRNLVPVLIGIPDLQVWKHKKVSVRSLQVNEGLHFNALVLLPPRFEAPQITGVRQSRLKDSLDLHVNKLQREYLTEKLYRIDVTPVEKGTMADYAFKNFLKGRFTSDDILVLN